MLTLFPHEYIVFDENDYTISSILQTKQTTETTQTINTCVPESTYTQLSNCINNDEQTSSDSDKSDDFVKLEDNI
jgi:hypothetical protein